MYVIKKSNLKNMIKLIHRLGLEKGENNYYSPALKQEMIDIVLLEVGAQN